MDNLEVEFSAGYEAGYSDGYRRRYEEEIAHGKYWDERHKVTSKIAMKRQTEEFDKGNYKASYVDFLNEENEKYDNQKAKNVN